LLQRYLKLCTTFKDHIRLNKISTQESHDKSIPLFFCRSVLFFLMTSSFCTTIS
jgi:hypothetical protein